MEAEVKKRIEITSLVFFRMLHSKGFRTGSMLRSMQMIVKGITKESGDGRAEGGGRQY